MMKPFFILLFAIAFKAPTLLAQEDTSIPRNWMYCNSTTFIYLTLDNDSTFRMHYQNGSINSDSNGGYSLIGNELMLISPKKTETFLYKDGKIASTPALKDTYTDFQPLEPTPRANLKDAYKECGILRMQQKKAANQKQ